MGVLLGETPRIEMVVESSDEEFSEPSFSDLALADCIERVLRLPAVASKSFLITIGDRTVTGLVCRDQMVGPWQVPVADAAVTAASFDTYAGEAMAMGERTPMAITNAPASGRMAVAEAVTNIACADIADISDIKLSANWMAASGASGEDAKLYATVAAVGRELCPELGIAIPVGKDSLSLQTQWRDDQGSQRRVVAPLSLVVSGFAPVKDVRKSLTPMLATDQKTQLLYLDLGFGSYRLGGSALSQVYGSLGGATPDLDSPGNLVAFFKAVQRLNAAGLLLAYHDRSDGGLLVTLLEMAFCSHSGLEIDLATLGDVSDHQALFAEELGAVIQIKEADYSAVASILDEHGLQDITHSIARPSGDSLVTIRRGDQRLFQQAVSDLHGQWAETSYRLQRLRDNPATAEQEFHWTTDYSDPGMSPSSWAPQSPMINTGQRPPVMILREQGVNGQVEMAAAFDRAGFEARDVHMSDIIAGHTAMSGFVGLVACGGFSYGDVLGAGEGWAKSILFNPATRAAFAEFFQRNDTFALGVCNGCQMLAAIKDIIPGASRWPRFVRNESEQFEARLSMVEVQQSNSIFLGDMAGGQFPIAVAHGEGQVEFSSNSDLDYLEQNGHIAARFVDNRGVVTESYPANPNGSANGITAVCDDSGRFTIMMPHPERVFRSVQYSWRPASWGEDGPWMSMFHSARRFIG